MAPTTFRFRGQVEDNLGRPLTQEELSPAESLETLSPAHLAVVETLAPRSTFAARLYLRSIVSTSLTQEFQTIIDDFASGLRSTQPKEWPNLPLFERYAGRVLSPAEKQSVASLEELSPAHLAIASMLAREEHPIAFLYLRRVVPSAALEACGDLVKQLATRSGA